MRALKAVVIVMGIMLVAGFAALILAVAGRVSRNVSSSAASHPFATNAIDIPRGARIEAMTTAPNRLILDLVLPDDTRQIVVLDLATGSRLGTIELRPAP